MTIFQKAIQRHNEKQYKKPKYPIKKLYIGQIVQNTNREFVGFGIWDDYSKMIKPYAIFLKVSRDEFIHIKSGQKLKSLGYNVVGDYAVRNALPWQEAYIVQMREDGDTPNTKLSKNFIDMLETEFNIKIVEGKTKKQDLFGL